MTKDSNLLYYTANCAMFTCLYTMLIIWPASEIYMGYFYKDQITCETTMFVTLSNWLIIKGSVTVSCMSLIFLLILSSKDSTCSDCIHCILYIVYLFTFAWLIIGSIIFWRDCINTEPLLINTYMWFSLIIGFITVVNFPNNKDSYKIRPRPTTDPIPNIA